MNEVYLGALDLTALVRNVEAVMEHQLQEPVTPYFGAIRHQVALPAYSVVTLWIDFGVLTDSEFRSLQETVGFLRLVRSHALFVSWGRRTFLIPVIRNCDFQRTPVWGNQQTSHFFVKFYVSWREDGRGHNRILYRSL